MSALDLNVRPSLIDRIAAFTEAPAAPTTAADRAEPDPAYQLTTENLRRLADRHSPDVDGVQGHAA